MGKSRLAQKCLAAAPGRPALVEGLLDLGRLFGDLSLPPGPALGDPGLKRTRLFESVCRLLERASYEAERRPVAEHNTARSADPKGSFRDAEQELHADLGGRITHIWLPPRSQPDIHPGSAGTWADAVHRTTERDVEHRSGQSPRAAATRRPHAGCDHRPRAGHPGRWRAAGPA
jgi:hypothetical protein